MEELGSSDTKETFISDLYELRKRFEFFTAKNSPAISRSDVGTRGTWVIAFEVVWQKAPQLPIWVNRSYFISTVWMDFDW